MIAIPTTAFHLVLVPRKFRVPRVNLSGLTPPHFLRRPVNLFRRLACLFLLVATLVIAAFAAPAAPAAKAATDLELIAKPFFQQHCTSCHGAEKQKADLRVDTLVIDFDSPKIMGLWEEIMNRVNSGDMPPAKEPRPQADDLARLAEWIAGQLRDAESARQAAGGERVAFRKLSREEYANTIRDLLGVTFDVTDPTGLPEDPDWQGFQRIGSVLTLSPAHVEKYLAAAETVLNEALSLGAQPKREVIHWSPFDIRGWQGFEKDYQARGMADKVRVDLVPNNGALDDRTLEIKTAGDYLVRLKASGLRAGNCGGAWCLRRFSVRNF